MDHTTARSRSYTIRESVPVGTAVVFIAEAVYYEPIPAGTRGTVTDYSNAGFRGIEASVRLEDGRLVHGISAGVLARSDQPAVAVRWVRGTTTYTDGGRVFIAPDAEGFNLYADRVLRGTFASVADAKRHAEARYL